ncbi:MAG: phospho-N-acetylmuramoyl-pentapeptide-transferase, partial [Acidobacteriota bacterium]
MLYWLLVPLEKYFSVFNVFGYYTVRTALAGITALLVSFIFGPWVIKTMRKRQIGEEIRPEGPQSHLAKKGTPSMGGLLIIGSTIIPTLLWGNLSNMYVWLGIISMLSFGAIGFADDYLKVKKRRSLGLRGKTKIALQFALAGLIGLALVYIGLSDGFSLNLSFPFFKKWVPFLGWFYLPWIILILV